MKLPGTAYKISMLHLLKEIREGVEKKHIKHEPADLNKTQKDY